MGAEAKIEHRSSVMFNLSRGLTAFKNLVSGTPEPQIPVADSDEVQEILEAAVQRQAELEFVQQECRTAQQECKTLKEEVLALRAAQHSGAQEDIRRLKEEAEAFQAECAELRGICSIQSAAADEGNAKLDMLMQENQELSQKVAKYEARVETLVVERGNLSSQLKQLRTPSDGRPGAMSRADNMTLDPFDNKVDQVSEAAVKSGVESLNDTLDTLTMTWLDAAEELANQNSHSTLPSAVQEHPNTKLMNALAEYGQGEEKRGFLLDATIHDALVIELDRLFFSENVIPRVRAIFEIWGPYSFFSFRTMDGRTTVASTNCDKRSESITKLSEAVEELDFRLC
ncbi:hypothetical protein C8R44DRAFT_788492 [Mycena epipterygia]|nr:hypothetical protein C8R44DRAFT_788492 [Mycena epipterygia]